MHNEGSYKQGEKEAFRMEKIIANKTTDKELISKICKQLMQLNTRKNKEPKQKVDKRTKQTFLQRSIQMANKHMKTCSTSLIIREMQIKTRMRYHLMPVRMAIIKSPQTANA